MSVSTALTSVILSVVSTPKRKLNLAFAGVLVSSIGLILFGMARNVALLSISLFMVMMPLPALNVVFKTILQEKTPEDLQGRVFSSAYQLAYGIAPLSFLAVGGLVDKHVEPYVQS
ncbi:MFS transporter, partial [Aduncisulcus paluster]